MPKIPSIVFLEEPMLFLNALSQPMLNGLVVKVLDSQSRGLVLKTTGWLQS